MILYGSRSSILSGVVDLGSINVYYCNPVDKQNFSTNLK